MKKVFVFITQMEPGGAQMAAIKLMRGLTKRGYNAKIFFLYSKRPIPGIPIQFRVLTTYKPKHLWFFPVLLFQLFKVLKKEKPDTVISFTYYANIMTQLVAFLTGVSSRIASQRSVRNGYPFIAKILDQLLGTLGIYTHNIMVSKTAMDSFKNCPKAYKRRFSVVYNGIMPEQGNTVPWNLREKIDTIREKDSIIISVGRLSYPKNHQILIRALENLPSVHFVLIGEGELHNELIKLAIEKKIEKRFTILPEVKNDDVIGIVSQGDIFVFPSLYEGMSNSLIEALFANIPILASNIPSNKEVLCENADDQPGNLLSSNDVFAWQNAISSILGDQAKRDDLVKQARRLSKRFTIDKMIQGFENVI
ncbi:MAG: glycosyltransferase [Fibrobacteria bacterium]|nr:glycosyltransferase [Fibrobacteria bacterium]